MVCAGGTLFCFLVRVCASPVALFQTSTVICQGYLEVSSDLHPGGPIL